MEKTETQIIEEGRQAQELLDHPLMREWWELVNKGLLDVVAGESPEFGAQVWLLRGAYRLRTHLITKVQMANDLIRKQQEAAKREAQADPAKRTAP